ncbi:MAG: UDP-N-acetylmuramoyl-L-alanine--D-glutamate ligase [Actinobacteria bacterium]|nr:UDP-N-acetylmuramoyl-L-alanine--D-glutamate ligase [Actinomycetota bacterium]
MTRSFAGVRVLIVGLGVSGYAAARALAELDAKVRVTDNGTGDVIEERAGALRRLGVEVETGGHDLEAVFADIAVLSPGIPLTVPLVERLRAEGVTIWSEVELGYQLARCDFVAVTGTNGKTTTTGLLANMLQEGGIESLAAGNIGVPLVEAVSTVSESGAIAVEVSSFQLATIETFRARVAVLLNVDEDHTDWHGSIAAYVAAKERITLNQTPHDVLVFNLEDATCRDIAQRSAARTVPFATRTAPAEGIGVDGTDIEWRGERVFGLDDVVLPGAVGLQDSLAAAVAALEYGVDGKAVVRALKGFRPLPHRLELVADANGVSYIDDSKATNPHATVAAVKGLEQVILIAGGRSKDINLSRLAETVPPVTGVVAMGEASDEVRRVFEDLVPVRQVADMDEAVRAANEMSVPGGSVLLSPGCASLDMYQSYAARGEDFRRAVKELLQDEGHPRRDDGIT